ncbi:antirepressor [Sporosarcina sp. NCCP-2222]|uniref:Rha family transcriptional regulator n=1 Tax=Sporosarcina sp. NCCP-2222 TaxID=2935073 RepID=UPI002087F99A|nr:Rha family transcriptional regulator [Sporosarcina sp. NCCP-2222]GKV54274.1 antirepressor [Sporosarcina sp. NCCP-2222]
MNQLKVISMDGQLVTESRLVAEMVEQQHKELLRTIRNYIGILTGAGLRSLDFFIPHTYQDAKKEVRPCFLITRKGCDMVANKMTGEKGVLFTAEYVTRFEEMEKELHTPKRLTPKEQLMASMQLTLETAQEVEEIKGKVEELQDKLENQLTLDYGMQRRLQKAVATRVYALCGDDQVRPKLFRELYREIKDRFGVASYKDVRRQDLQAAIWYVEAWIPRRAA